jgi:hypothetical protein
MKESAVSEKKAGSVSAQRAKEAASFTRDGVGVADQSLMNIVQRAGCRNCGPSVRSLAGRIMQTSAAQRQAAAMSLQMSRGNRFVQGLAVQAKLVVGPADDEYEREADRVARLVVDTISSSDRDTVQRKEAEEEEKELQRKVEGLATAGGSVVGPDLESAIQRARSGGQSLPDGIRQPMERAFGTDFGGVRVHTDGEADRLNRSIQARAFTTGQNIFLRQGEFRPGSTEGQRLLAHELTHVVQQKLGRVRETRPINGMEFNDDVGLENEAERNGSIALRNGMQYGEPEKEELLQRKFEPIQYKFPEDMELLQGSFHPIQRYGNERMKEAEISAGYSERKYLHEKRTMAEKMLILKLPGSSFEKMKGEDEKDAGIKIVEKGQILFKKYDSFAGIDGMVPVWTIAGPLALKGFSDSGPNSIANNIKKGKEIIRDFVDSYQKSDPSVSFLILIKSHSRNAVACTHISNYAKGLKTERSKVDVEAVFFDPVPGPLQSKEYQEADVSGLTESTLVYSLHTQYILGFNPQKVKGAKRVILSRKDHGVGYSVGVTYKGGLYRGFSLNKLPQGVYLSKRKVAAEEPEEIELVSKSQIEAVFKEYGKKESQKGRRNVIKGALQL